MKPPIKLKSLETIKQKSIKTGNGLDCFIALAGGLMRSSKNIYWNGKKYKILNEIDGTTQNLTEKQIFDERYTNIGKALKVGALYQYNF